MACFVQEGPPCRRVVLTVSEHFPASFSLSERGGRQLRDAWKRKMQIGEDDQDRYC